MKWGIVLGAIFHAGAIGILLWMLFGRGKPAPGPELTRPEVAAVPSHRATPRTAPTTTPVHPPGDDLPVDLPPAGTVSLNTSPPSPPPPLPPAVSLPPKFAPLAREIESGLVGPVHALALLPDGKHAVVGAGDHRLHLVNTVAGREVKAFDGTATDVHCLAMNYLGTAVASGGEDGIVRIWDVALGREAFALPGHRGIVRGIAFSPNGQYVVSGADDGSVRVWDLSTREPVRELKLGRPVTAVAFHPDGRRAVVGGDHGIIFVLDLEAATRVHTLGGHVGPVNAVALSPDGRQAVSVGEDKTMRFWEVATGARVKIPGPTGKGTFTHIRSRQPLRAVAYAGDGSWVVGSGVEPAVTVATVDGRSRANLALSNPRGPVVALAVAPDASGVVLATSQGALQRMDFQGGTVTTTAGPPSDEPTQPPTRPQPPSTAPTIPSVAPKWTSDAAGTTLRSVAVAANGRVVAGGIDRTVRVWDPDGNDVNSFPHMAGLGNNVAISRDGAMLLVGGNTPEPIGRLTIGTDCLLRTVTLKGNRVAKVAAHPSPITALALAPNGRAALTGSESVVRYWDALQAREIRQYVGHSSTVRAVDFHPKLLQAVSVAADNTARIWDLNGTKLIRTISGLPGAPQGIAFSPDGRSILVYGPGVLGTWDAVTGNPLRSFETPTKGRPRTRPVLGEVSAAWAPDGTIVTATAGAVALHDADTWEELTQFSGPPAFVHAVAVSADGRHVVAVGRGLTAWQLDKPLFPAAAGP